jgi:integrase
LDKPGLHFVGNPPGLALHVAATGARSWILRVRVSGKRRDMGLGSYPGVPLADARRRARELREQVAKGQDPLAERDAAKSAARAALETAKTFRDCAEAYIEAHAGGWRNAKHSQQWRNTLEAYAYPKFGSLLVKDVALPHILAMLEPIWHTKTETASRVRGRVEKVLDWAKGRNYREGDNPAAWKGNLEAQLPRPEKVAKVEHHPAVPVMAMADFMSRLRACTGMGALALEFAILTAARSGEVRGATLEEIDREGRVWNVPGSRMKAGKDHRVPLSDAALAVLDKAAAVPRVGQSTLVFFAPRGGALSDMTLTAVMRRLDVAAVPHGFRSTFRDWAAECTDYPREVAEMALAHAIGDKVEAAYRRGDLFEKRRQMMADWSAHVGGAGAKSEA